MNMKKWIAILLALLCIYCSTACSKQEEAEQAIEISEIQIDPTEESINTNTMRVKLYFANEDYTMLVGEEVEIEVPVSSRVEYSILEGLLYGPRTGAAGFQALVNPQTEIISIDETEEYLSITLSKEFLDWSFITDINLNAERFNQIRRLSVYSIVNSIIETSACKKVQILIEDENSRTGQRIPLAEVGMGSIGVLEPLERSGSVVLSAQTTLNHVFDALSAANYTGLYQYVAYTDEDGSARPSENNFSVWIQSLNISVESYQITELVETVDKERAILMIDYVLNMGEAGRKRYTNIPVRLVKENGLWKIHYSMLETLF